MKSVWAAVTAVLACACTGAPRSGTHWHEVGNLDGGFIRFVEVDAASAKDGAVYKNAADTLMADGKTWQIGFFLPGDAVPQFSSRGAFFRAGGWSGYKPLATYMKDGFTQWDCDRAGVEDAPASALCGEGVEEQYVALMHIATRDAWVTACGLPKFNGRAVVEKYAAQFGEQKRADVMKTYETSLAESMPGPDNPANCQNLRSRIMGWGTDARKTLMAATPKG